MLTGAAMAAVPQAAATRAVSGSQPGAGFRSAVSGGRAALLRPTVARRPVRAAPVLTRAGEALDWENDDFVPASKANKKKKSKGGNAAQQAKQTKKNKAAPVAESLDWENDDFVPAGKAKKNKKKPKAGGAQAAADVEPPPIVADVPDWENDDFVPAGKAKKNKKKAKQAPEPEPEPEPGRGTGAESPRRSSPERRERRASLIRAWSRRLSDEVSAAASIALEATISVPEKRAHFSSVKIGRRHSYVYRFPCRI